MKPDDGPGSAKAFNVKVEGWRPRERFREEDAFAYPHPGRVALLERIVELQAAPDAGEELGRVQKLYDSLEGHFPVWEENHVSIQAFLKIRTQWRTGAAGATGLDYLAVERRVQRMKLAADDEERVLQDLELMESVILMEWGRQRKESADELDRNRGAR